MFLLLQIKHMAWDYSPAVHCGVLTLLAPGDRAAQANEIRSGIL
jgi:hypothetical protein